MKVWLFLVLLLIVLSCEAGKKKKKKKGNPSDSLKNRFLRRRPTTPTKPPPVSAMKKVNMQKVDFTTMNTTDQFYEVFKLPRLQQNRNGSGGSDHSTAVQGDSDWSCKIRPTLVHLPAPAYGKGFYFPSCATVNRCSGCCGVTNVVCKPVAVHEVKVDYYHIHPELGGLYEEKSMRLEEHHACACQCSQTAASCDPITQFWNPGLCQCECLPNYQEDQMNCGGNFQYDARRCRCVCKTRRHCDHDPNLMWSDEECNCVCKKQDCPSRQYLNPDTCKCVSVLGQRQ